jgi:hypothetical protein
MLEFIDSRDDAIALRLSGEVSGDDLRRVMDRVDQYMAGTGKVHVFVETAGIDALAIRGLPSYIARAMPLLGKLDRFGRVAVVADQPWVRFATRLESAILPGISYRTYLPEERDEALAWVLETP